MICYCYSFNSFYTFNSFAVVKFLCKHRQFSPLLHHLTNCDIDVSFLAVSYSLLISQVLTSLSIDSIYSVFILHENQMQNSRYIIICNQGICCRFCCKKTYTRSRLVYNNLVLMLKAHKFLFPVVCNIAYILRNFWWLKYKYLDILYLDINFSFGKQFSRFHAQEQIAHILIYIQLL